MLALSLGDCPSNSSLHCESSGSQLRNSFRHTLILDLDQIKGQPESKSYDISVVVNCPVTSVSDLDQLQAQLQLTGDFSYNHRLDNM